MTATSAPYGFRPYKMLGGRSDIGQINTYYVPSTDSTALYIGDPVIIAGSADADGIATVTRATAAGGNYITGIVVGFIPLTPIPAQPYRPASTAMYVLVSDDPSQLYVAQEDSVGGALAATNIGQNIDFVAGSGSTYTGLSGHMLDSSTAATTNTLQFRLIGFDTEPSNIGTAYQALIVKINLHSTANLTGI